MSKVRPKVLKSGELSYVTQKGPIFFLPKIDALCSSDS